MATIGVVHQNAIEKEFLPVRILAIESSCDETGAAVVDNGQYVLSNVVASQIDLHARFGGIVPEVASRQHILEIIPVIESALNQAQTRLDDLDAVAVTYGPGLMGSLMVGVNTAKAIAYANDLPLIAVDHLAGHTYAAWLEYGNPAHDPGFPLIVLIASGAHTDLMLMDGHGEFRLLGLTRDDASGEAFDKAARILGLGFPGGPAIQKMVENYGIQPSIKLPRAWLGGSLDFSFSGLKTALLHQAQDWDIYPETEKEPDDRLVAELATAFQEAVVDIMVQKTILAVKQTKARAIILGGGVSANGLLRREIKRYSEVPVLIPRPQLCTDNAAMIGAAGFFSTINGSMSSLDLDPVPNLRLGTTNEFSVPTHN
jgi:N6-L-threonylcarbamoyladenine synthase